MIVQAIAPFDCLSFRANIFQKFTSILMAERGHTLLRALPDGLITLRTRALLAFLGLFG
jgi:hypothetical protein